MSAGRDDVGAARLAAFLSAGTALATVPRAAGGGGRVHWSGETAHELLTFRLAGQLHALPIREVREVAKLPALTRLPRLPPHVLGLMSLRGDLLPVVDAAQVFGAQAQQLGSGGPPALRDAPPGEHATPVARGGLPPAATAFDAAPRPGHVIVLGDEQAPLGLAVERLLGVRRLPDEAVVPRSPLGGSSAAAGARDCIMGFASFDQLTVVVLDGVAVQRRFDHL